MFLGGGIFLHTKKHVEEVSENILQDQVSENIHSKAGVFKYILIEIPL